MQRVHANQELYVLYYLYLCYLWPSICLFVAHQHQHPSCSPLFDCLCLSKESGDLQESAGDESVYKDSVLGAKSLSQGTWMPMLQSSVASIQVAASHRFLTEIQCEEPGVRSFRGMV